MVGGFELSQGGFLALFVLGDSRRLLEQKAPFFSPVGDDGLDHLLLNDRVGMGAHTGVEKQLRYVL